MNKLNANPFNQPAEQAERSEEAQPQQPARKEFVEPVVSVPIDVLETTSFFQTVTTVDTSDV